MSYERATGSLHLSIFSGNLDTPHTDNVFAKNSYQRMSYHLDIHRRSFQLTLPSTGNPRLTIISSHRLPSDSRFTTAHLSITTAATLNRSTDSYRQGCRRSTCGTLHERHPRNSPMRVFKSECSDIGVAGRGSFEVCCVQCP